MELSWLQGALAQIENAKDLAELEGIRVSIVGKKGKLTEAFAELKNIQAEHKKEVAKTLNSAKSQIESALEKAKSDISQRLLESQLQSEKIGTSLGKWDIKINSCIKTGYNEAFIIDTATRDQILSKCKTPTERKHTEQLIKKMLKSTHIKNININGKIYDLSIYTMATPTKKGDKIPPIDINDYSTLKTYFDKKAKTLTGKGKGF